MPLIIEDGTIVLNSNSYVSVIEARSFADDRGLVLPSADLNVEKALILAMDYLESLKGNFVGNLVEPGVQSLQWPRKNVKFDEVDFPEDKIPLDIKKAQIQLALESSSGIDLMPTNDGREIIREKVDVLETEYAPSGNGSGVAAPSFRKVNALLSSFLKSSGFGSAQLNVIRA
ncbi:MAG: DnaT-like ssDNA-binding protein [Culicoidibacterales bacterium]